MTTLTAPQPSLTARRCLHHHDREAVARCPECHRFFCRECITEHDERVICATCLAALSRANDQSPTPWRIRGVLRSGGAVTGLLVTWLCFYLAGRLLLALPSEFHADSLWQLDWFDTAGEEGDE